MKNESGTRTCLPAGKRSWFISLSGIIKATWMEYVAHVFPQINDRNAMNIVLHLSKYRDREFTREDIIRKLKLEMSDAELELKLKALEILADADEEGLVQSTTNVQKGVTYICNCCACS